MTPEAKILHIAATLVGGRHLGDLSGYPDDMPKTTPISVLRSIEKADEASRKLGYDLRDALDGLSKELAAARAVVEAARALSVAIENDDSLVFAYGKQCDALEAYDKVRGKGQADE